MIILVKNQLLDPFAGEEDSRGHGSNILFIPKAAICDHHKKKSPCLIQQGGVRGMIMVLNVTVATGVILNLKTPPA